MFHGTSEACFVPAHNVSAVLECRANPRGIIAP